MSMCEYDRNLLKEVITILNEIKIEMKKSNDLNGTSLTYVVNRNNKQALIHQDAMRYHLELMEEQNDGG